MDTPYQWTKQVASHWGGTRNGTIVHWPNGIKAKGEIRSQFHHVIDLAPTVLEAAGLPHPTVVNSVQQAPIEGVSMLYAFNDAKAAERHETQYFEMFCNRGIYHKGWTAVTRHGVPWVGAYKRAFDEDVWELYDTNTDWTQSKDLAKENPKKLAELQRLFLIEATKYSAAAARRSDVRALQPGSRRPPPVDPGQHPDPLRRHGPPVGELGRIDQEQVVLDHRRCRGAEERRRGRHRRPGRQHERLEPLRESGQAEVLLQLLRHHADLRRIHTANPSRPSPGPHGVQVRRRGPGQGGGVTLYIDGKAVGQGRLEQTVPMAYSADETCDVGKEGGSPVSPDYGPTDNEFSGEVNWVQFDLEKDDHDHLISPDERFKVAMARQ